MCHHKNLIKLKIWIVFRCQSEWMTFWHIHMGIWNIIQLLQSLQNLWRRLFPQIWPTMSRIVGRKGNIFQVWSQLKVEDGESAKFYHVGQIMPYWCSQPFFIFHNFVITILAVESETPPEKYKASDSMVVWYSQFLATTLTKLTRFFLMFLVQSSTIFFVVKWLWL